MKLFDGVDVLELSMQGGAVQGGLHPLLLRGEDGVTLVDTGFPGQLPVLEEALRALGVGLSDIDRVILTHQDIDHIGNLPGIVQAGSPSVLAHADDVPYIEGRKPLIKLAGLKSRLSPEELERMRPTLEHPPAAPVDRLLADGEQLPIYGGVEVIHTPGHTPGHICLYLRDRGLLVAGDAMRVVDGELVGPWPQVTPDMAQAKASLRKLPKDVEVVLCYHGGVFRGDAAARFADIAAES